jgi:hypothetical protein
MLKPRATTGSGRAQQTAPPPQWGLGRPKVIPLEGIQSRQQEQGETSPGGVGVVVAYAFLGFFRQALNGQAGLVDHESAAD